MSASTPRSITAATPRSAFARDLIDGTAAILNVFGALTGPAPPKAYVIDRKGRRVPPRFDEITARIEALCSDPRYGRELAHIDAPMITQKVVESFTSGMTTRELDTIVARLCADHGAKSEDWLALSARICVSDLHKRSPASLTQMVAALRASPEGRRRCRLSKEYLGIIRRYGPEIDARIVHDRDYRFYIFGFQTLARSYLMRELHNIIESTLLDTQVMERPQHFYMRIAIGLFCVQPDGKGHLADPAVVRERLEEAFRYYEALSLQLISHATPTMLNAATKYAQLSSCFQLGTADDLSALFDTVKDAAMISKWSGGLSVWLHNVRAEHSPINGTGGMSSGIRHYLLILNEVMRYVDQGGNRPGAFAVYLEPWHADIFTFLRMARHREAIRASDLKYALWVPRLFVRAVENDEDWWLMSPDDSPDLYCVWGAEFEARYRKYVAEGRFREKVKARAIFTEMWVTIGLGGTPYMLLKDNVNAASNLVSKKAPKRVIASSNLCAEITIPSFSNAEAEKFGEAKGEGQTGVCNLAALPLEAAVREGGAPPEAKSRGAAEGQKSAAAPDAKDQKSAAAPDAKDQKSAAAPDAKDQKSADAKVAPKLPVALQADADGLLEAGQRLAQLMRQKKIWYDFKAIIDSADMAAEALDRLIDINKTPTKEGQRSNEMHRPIGLGIMGLADVFARLGIAYGSPEARALDRAISAAVYYGAMRASSRVGERKGHFPSFPTTRSAEGLLAPDIWVKNGNLRVDWEAELEPLLGAFVTAEDWETLRARLRKGFLRNCYVTAQMPTSTSSNIVGANECAEPYTAKIYARQTLAGQFIVIDRHMVRDLRAVGMWSSEMRERIINAKGSIQSFEDVPKEIRDLHKTAREIDYRLLLLHAKARAPFVSQSMSLNAYSQRPTIEQLLTTMSLADRMGLPVAWYYQHSAPAAGALQAPPKAAPAAPPKAAPAAPPMATAAPPKAPAKVKKLFAAPTCTPECGSCAL